jgi:hypothetical protein
MNPFSSCSEHDELVAAARRDSAWHDLIDAMPIVLFSRGLLALWKGRSRTVLAEQTAKFEREPASRFSA